MTAHDVKINKDTFDLISKLSSIQPAIIFEKKNDDIIVNRSNVSTTIVYRLKFPQSHFSFNGDEVCFANFPEFYQLFCVLNDATVTQTTEKNHELFVLSKNTSKIKYLVSDAESLKRGPENISWSNADATVKLSSADLRELTKAVGLVAADSIRFTVEKGKDLSMNVSKGPNDNSFEKTFPMTIAPTSDFSLTIEAEFFLLLPDNDCVLEINKDGLIRVSFVKNDVSVELFTGTVDED